MKEDSRSESTLGSVTPQLEGATHSTVHPTRMATGTIPKPKEGGTKHE